MGMSKQNGIKKCEKIYGSKILGEKLPIKHGKPSVIEYLRNGVI